MLAPWWEWMLRGVVGDVCGRLPHYRDDWSLRQGKLRCPAQRVAAAPTCGRAALQRQRLR